MFSLYLNVTKPESDDDYTQLTEIDDDTQLIVVKGSRSARFIFASANFIILTLPLDLTSIRQLAFALFTQLTWSAEDYALY